MRYLSKWRTAVSGVSLSVIALVAAASGVASAAPALAQSDQAKGLPPLGNVVSGKQDKPAIEPGSRDAKQSERLGPTNLVKTDATGKLQAPDASTRAGYVAGVDFLAPLNYCWKNLVYAPVQNTTAATKYVQVRVYNQTGYRDIYTSVAANSTIYPASYGIDGAYSAYLYVWNGSSYQYDEYRGGTNTCNVSVTRTYNTAGWVQLKIQNLGTAYATQISNELAPFPAAGTYTGTQYDYPAVGGAALYRWFWVGTSPYGIVSSTYGSFNLPYYFTGDL